METLMCPVVPKSYKIRGVIVPRVRIRVMDDLALQQEASD